MPVEPPTLATVAAQAADPKGTALVAAWTAAVDRWVGALFQRATGADRRSLDGDLPTGVALVATGGYGRGQLCPGSDLDLLLLHTKAVDIGPIADALWYPIWDAGMRLGHSVQTPREALALAGDDLDTATALLDVRCLCGDRRLADELARSAAAQWEARGERWLARLADSVDHRHARAGEVAFLLEPDLKRGRGGLRDVHAVRWAERAHQVLLKDDQAPIDEAEAALLAVRAELHRSTGRSSDVLTLDQQDAVAAALAVDGGGDGLMALVAERGRTIAWRSDETWHRVRAMLARPSRSPAGRTREIGEGLALSDGEVHLVAPADPSGDPAIGLRAAAAAARCDARIHRRSLERLAAETSPFGDRWPPGAREALVDLLAAGRASVRQVEALDQLGVWARYLPEWTAVRNRPQRNAYHTYTVDRHLLETAAGAAELGATVDRADLLLLAALLHDIGKGHPGDHTEVGMDLVARIGPRTGLDPEGTATLVRLVEHHLLLADVATRRDLDDPATAEAVAERVGSRQTLDLLHGLTVADSLATGPAAWGTWKAGLVATLVERTVAVLDAGPRSVPTPSFPGPEHRALLAAATPLVRGEGEVLTVVARDRPGLLGRVAGALALNGLDVLSVEAVSSDDGWALERVRIERPARGSLPWDRITSDVDAAIAGHLALRARLAERQRSQRPLNRLRSAGSLPAEVRFDNEASRHATVVEVHARDSTGLLERICRALAEMDLDVRSAKVQTLGDRVVDAFYVRRTVGTKITDTDDLAEVERALLHAIDAG